MCKLKERDVSRDKELTMCKTLTTKIAWLAKSLIWEDFECETLILMAVHYSWSVWYKPDGITL
jgi:hypothetical protein